MSVPILNYSKKVEFWIENEILFCKFNQADCYLTIESAEAYLLKILKLTEGKPRPLLIDIRNFTGNFSPLAAKFFTESSILKHFVIAQAFVVNTLNGKLLIGSYKRLFAQGAHVQIFGDTETALAFCMESKNTYNV
ncbi:MULTISPECIES: DUF7793 family protein [Bizionia]|uniref:DUF7793 domain-containing protein n=1 Tax=Bizionia algoritergicola TaxID=291187 RepID=A0A5D0R2I4_9FLAO|nr:MULTISPECIES: hypothetical protein [Bizionia]OBX23094.1 hypothetical protein BAA08_06040 [Bizionia sp. APA-3]TYB74754.1 hypothetical protein ES675_01055 [Bizionia algoritergicola]